MVERAKDWPPVLAFGLPAIVAVLLIAVLSPFLSTGVLLLVGGVIFMILACYIVVVYREIPSRSESKYQKPVATINQPFKNKPVDRTILCNGTATGIQDNMHLWLAVETYDKKVRIWPKEGELVVNKANDCWSSTIFEDGATQQFSIAVYLADNVGHQFILDWLEAGRLKGEYGELMGINGTERLTRVEGLTLS